MNLTISQRLALGYAAAILLVLVLGSYVALKIDQIHQIVRRIEAVEEVDIRNTGKLMETFFSQVNFAEKYLVNHDPDFYSQFQALRSEILNGIDRQIRLVDSKEQRESFEHVKYLYGRYLDLFQREKELVPNSSDDSRRQFVNERTSIVDAISLELKRAIERGKAVRAELVDLSGSQSVHVMKVSTGVAAVIVILGFLISFLTSRQVIRAVNRLQRKTREIAEGRFEEVSGISSPPEIARLAADFNKMSNRLNELDQMKIDFMNHVSHKLRTPLMAIRLSSEVLLEEYCSGLSDKQRELIQIVEQEGGKLVQTVNRLLDLSRMEASMMSYEFLPCNIDGLLRSAVLRLAPIAMKKNIDLQIEPLPELPAVNIEENRIAEVIENLVGNALKFTPEGGSVTVSASLINGEDSAVKVSVSDTGVGVAEENAELIFEKFQSLGTSTAGSRGTGLGLAISKQIVTAHGGQIWVESTPGKGSIFSFTVPYSSQQP
jgi:two-component system sensor histidine kinase GlrK